SSNQTDHSINPRLVKKLPPLYVKRILSSTALTLRDKNYFCSAMLGRSCFFPCPNTNKGLAKISRTIVEIALIHHGGYYKFMQWLRYSLLLFFALDFVMLE